MEVKISVPKVNKNGLIKRLERSGHAFLKKNHIHLGKTTASSKELLNRALERKKPFGETDEGLKDTLIWTTLIKDAQKNKNTHFILLTKNLSDFVPVEMEKEFVSQCGSERSFRILPDTSAVKVFFDQELNLDLNLKEKHRKVKEIIKENIPNIIEAINKSPFPQMSSSRNGIGLANYVAAGYRDVTRVRDIYTGEDEQVPEAVLGYRLLEDGNALLSYRENPQIADISQVGNDENVFNVEIIIRTVPITSTDIKPKRTSGPRWGGSIHEGSEYLVNTLALLDNDYSQYQYAGGGNTIKNVTVFSMVASVNIADEEFTVVSTYPR